MRKLKVHLSFLLLLPVFMQCGTDIKETGEEIQPNIILILADDMGFSDIGCYGSEIRTPNLDRLAADGTRFSSMYNNARCCPSRAALLTGLYPHQAGVGEMTDTDLPIPEYQGFLNEQSVTIADVLRDAGYSTYLSGKWHLGEEAEHWPLNHGFDKCFAFINGASSYFDFLPYRNKQWPPGNKLTIVRDNQPIDLSDSVFYATDLYTDQALNYISMHPAQKPYFLYLAYTAPHWPLHALPEDIERYEGVYEEGWEVIRQNRFNRLQELGLIDPRTLLSEKNRSDRDWEGLGPDERANEARLMEVYAAMIDRMDQNIGRLLNHLEKHKMLDNTLIMFLSDNGGCKAGSLASGKYAHQRHDPHALPGTPESFTGYGPNWANVSNTPFREYKSDVHEGGIASPFIAWYPGHIPAEKINHSVVHIVDILPTLAELAGTDYPGQFKGRAIKPKAGLSLLANMREQLPIPERALFFEHLGRCGIILANWKLVRFRDQDWELYKLDADRSETEDLAGAYPGKVDELAEKYDKWAVKNRVLPREEVEKAMIYKF